MPNTHLNPPPLVEFLAHFTTEALPLELFGLSAIMALYSARWILHRRQYGATPHHVPAGLVRVYLNDLITAAERLRIQLFGLYSAPAHLQESTVSPARIHELEIILAEKDLSATQMSEEIERLGRQLREVQAGATQGGSAQLESLNAQVALLEGRLAEYSIIEDDLANLKRLQHENLELRGRLQELGQISGTPVESAVWSSSSPSPGSSPTALDTQPPTPSPQTTTTVEASAHAAEQELVAEFEKMLK